MRNSRRGAVDPFIVMDVLAAARAAEAAGRHIVHMEVGQPATGAPAAATARLAEALGGDPLGYTQATGLPELRAAIAQLYDKWYGITLDPARVVVTAGASGAFVLAFSALFDSGERVGIGRPGYPSYRQILRALGIEAVDIETRAENRLQPVADDIAAHALDGLLVASPANPTGTMLDHAALAALIEAAQEAGAAFISDEIYHGLDYGTRAVSALEVSDEVIVINSFSKYFSMTGWRVGWMVVPDHMVRRVENLAANLFICAPHAAQVAALGALEAHEECQANLSVYTRNRELMLKGLLRAGFDKIAPPDGAFYVYADVSEHTDDSLAFCAEVLEKAGVAITPGLDFDPVRGNRTVRFSYAGATEDIEEGLRRLAAFMADR
ncbi:pyridoxal phosphate-dependent aminotransferase [Pseudaestuariivita atlantica]|uniref:Aminotransferase n=1 Tax=Pseudaestuariivita atlantica TaxID=1317121 RepID=A0A0L1JV67_9RHOB|nr:aminotransferase class I/II-fold pyridoxal phosphate-dependent enzyme [Pseudaestuariivita atlantica]KNG95293.1 1-aminocyclopropane-1-carboxylate deaminase [Pseudaestuariivita atlantica]